MDEKCLFKVKLFFLFMRWPLISYRIVLVIFSIAIMIISFMCVYPVASQDITVEPQQDSFDWNIDNDTISASANVWLNNSGYFDLEDLKLDIHLSTLNKLYINSTENIGTVSVGENRDIKLDFSKDTSEISDDVKEHLINNETDVNIKIDIRGGYSYSLIEFDIHFEDILTWDGVVNDVNFLYEQGTVEQTGTGLIIDVPVEVDTNDMLDGQINVDVEMRKEGGKTYDTAQEKFELGTAETLIFSFFLERSEANEFINTSQNIEFESIVRLEGTSFEYSMTKSYHWKRILNNYNLKYDQAEITTESGNQYLTVPMEISTNKNDFIKGDVLTKIGLYNGSKRYSEDEFTIKLGQNESRNLEFRISNKNVKDLVTNSQEITYKTNITLLRYGYTFDYNGKQYEWGAPLNNLDIRNVRYSGNEAFADITFENDSPHSLDLTIDVELYNSADDLVGETQESYYISSGENFDDTLSTTLTGVPEYAVVTVEEGTTGFVYRQEVNVYEN